MGSVQTLDQIPVLDQRFAVLKQSLVKSEHKEKVIESYGRLCNILQHEANLIAKAGPSIIPDVDFSDVREGFPPGLIDLIRDRGCVILRNVVSEADARAWEAELKEYTRRHPRVGGYPAHDPQNWSLWWTRPQVQIRSHPRVLEAMRIVSKLWHVSDCVPVDLDSQVAYPDRFRIRHPSKDEYPLPAHLDSGSIERWECPQNRSNFQKIFEGEWDSWDAWAADHRHDSRSDLYETGAACSCWRSLQGWLSLSQTSTGEGTLRLLPSLKASVAYMMLRPLFLNGEFDGTQPTFPGATPGFTQFRPTKEFHPHLMMEKSIVGIPPVKPGDYAFWHCDLVHEVDRFHPGTTDSSVVYNACTPLTPYNIESLVATREAFNTVRVPKDFAKGEIINETESEHDDHGARKENILSHQGMQAMGFERFDVDDPGITAGQRRVREMANERLGL